MGNTWITDITHFLSGNELAPDMPAHAKKLAEYFGKIISSATEVKSGVELHTSISCRRRPGRKKCTGKLIVLHQVSTSDIIWRCPVCGDNGIIRNWRGTIWDRKST